MAWIWQHIGGDWTPPPKNLRLLLSSTVVVTCTRVKKNSNWYKIHRSLPLVCITWSLLRFWPTWLGSQFWSQWTCSAAAECNKRKVGLGHNSGKVSCSAVKIWHTRQLPPLQIGLMRVGFQRERETTAVVVKPTCSDKYFLLKFLGETGERESVFLSQKNATKIPSHETR